MHNWIDTQRKRRQQAHSHAVNRTPHAPDRDMPAAPPCVIQHWHVSRHRQRTVGVRSCTCSRHPCLQCLLSPALSRHHTDPAPGHPMPNHQPCRLGQKHDGLTATPKQMLRSQTTHPMPAQAATSRQPGKCHTKCSAARQQRHSSSRQVVRGDA